MSIKHNYRTGSIIYCFLIVFWTKLFLARLLILFIGGLLQLKFAVDGVTVGVSISLRPFILLKFVLHVAKEATIHGGRGGGWIFCHGQIIHFHPDRRRDDFLKFY